MATWIPNTDDPKTSLTKRNAHRVAKGSVLAQCGYPVGLVLTARYARVGRRRRSARYVKECATHARRPG
jgi:hypothetical protein